MASVRLARSAEIDLEALIASHSLPITTRSRVRDALQSLERFPRMGTALTGRWQGFRFVLGPWPWMLLIYVYDDGTDTVSVFFVQDARAARSATSSRYYLDGVPYAGDLRSIPLVDLRAIELQVGTRIR